MLLAFVATTLGPLAPDLLRYLLLCAGQAAQRASVASVDASVPVDEDDAEPEDPRNPTFPQLRAPIFQQLKNSVLVEALEAVAGRVLGRYMGVRSDPLLRHFLEVNRAPCVPALLSGVEKLVPGLLPGLWTPFWLWLWVWAGRGVVWGEIPLALVCWWWLVGRPASGLSGVAAGGVAPLVEGRLVLPLVFWVAWCGCWRCGPFGSGRFWLCSLAARPWEQ